MFHDNLVNLRKLNRMTQEQLAEAVGVSRQAIAKWESGESLPDLDRSRRIAEIFGVSLDDLANFQPSEEDMSLGVPPKGKHLFGVITVGEKGQVVIPARARKIFGIEPGMRMVVLGDETQGLALVKADNFLSMANMIQNKINEDT